MVFEHEELIAMNNVSSDSLGKIRNDFCQTL